MNDTKNAFAENAPVLRGQLMAIQNDITELKISKHSMEQSQRAMENALTRMADSMQKLTALETQRISDAAAITRAFAEIGALEAVVLAIQGEQRAYILAQATSKNAGFWDVAKIVLAAAVSALVAFLFTKGP